MQRVLLAYTISSTTSQWRGWLQFVEQFRKIHFLVHCPSHIDNILSIEMSRYFYFSSTALHVLVLRRELSLIKLHVCCYCCIKIDSFSNSSLSTILMLKEISISSFLNSNWSLIIQLDPFYSFCLTKTTKTRYAHPVFQLAIKGGLKRPSNHVARTWPHWWYFDDFRYIRE